MNTAIDIALAIISFSMMVVAFKMWRITNQIVKDEKTFMAKYYSK